METKRCSKCGEERAVEEFNERRGSCKICMKVLRKKYEQKNRKIINLRTKKWRSTHKTEIKTYKRKHYIKHRKQINAYVRNRYLEKPELWHKAKLKASYGLEYEVFAEMMKKQSGVCAICGNQNTNGRRLSIDHSHLDGKIRGLLCGPCNSAIGLVRENENILKQMISYLTDHKDRPQPASDPFLF